MGTGLLGQLGGFFDDLLLFFDRLGMGGTTVLGGLSGLLGSLLPTKGLPDFMGQLGGLGRLRMTGSPKLFGLGLADLLFGLGQASEPIC